MGTHRFDPVDWAEKKQAKQDLDQPHAPAHSVPVLRDRVDRLERINNVVPNE